MDYNNLTTLNLQVAAYIDDEKQLIFLIKYFHVNIPTFYWKNQFSEVLIF